MIRAAIDLSDDFESTSRFLSNLPGYITLQDVNSKFLAANHASTITMGFKNFSHLYGRYPADIQSRFAEIHEQVVEHNRFVIKQNSSITSLCSGYFANNEWKLFILQQQPLLDKDNLTIGIISQSVDVTSTPLAANLAPLFLEVNKKHKINLAQGIYQYSTQQGHLKLSKRQSECFFWLLHKKTSVEIGQILGLTKRTVESYIRVIKAKLNVNTLSELLDFAHEHQLHSFIPQHWLI